jgi:hypothetical protein
VLREFGLGGGKDMDARISSFPRTFSRLASTRGRLKNSAAGTVRSPEGPMTRNVAQGDQRWGRIRWIDDEARAAAKNGVKLIFATHAETSIATVLKAGKPLR